MDRRFQIVALASIVLGAGRSAPADGPTRPNIVFVIADDLRDELGTLLRSTR